MELTKEEREYYRLTILAGPPYPSEEEEEEEDLEKFLDEYEGSIENFESLDRCTLGLPALGRVAFAVAGAARTQAEALDLHQKNQPGAGLHDQGQGEPLAPLSLYNFARYRGTRAGC